MVSFRAAGVADGCASREADCMLSHLHPVWLQVAATSHVLFQAP